MTEENQLRPDPDDCVIPHQSSPEALERYLLKQSPFDGSDEIRKYVEWESPDEEVTYLERLYTERVMGTDYQVWDVHTTGERYWVITNLTNLYEQRLFPSSDYTLTFHVGLMARITARREARADEEQRGRLMSPWRRWTQAAEALDNAHESEEFQAVGMRCREALLDLVRSIASESMVPPGRDVPKMGSFTHWTELISDALASGSSAKEVRSYLKTVARAAWQLVSWLTHAGNAIRLDAEMAVEATHTTLDAYGAALIRFEHGTPDRCPQCGSYKVATRFLPKLDAVGPYVTVCESCDWVDTDQASP